MKKNAIINLNNPPEIELGDLVRDRITGFEGVCVAITDWLFQCRQIQIRPTSLEKLTNAPKRDQAFDEHSLEIVRKNYFKVDRGGEVVDEVVPLRRAASKSKKPAKEAKTGGPAVVMIQAR